MNYTMFTQNEKDPMMFLQTGLQAGSDRLGGDAEGGSNVKAWKAEIVLTLIVLATSSSYLFTKWGISDMGAFTVVALRLLIAVTVIAACCVRRLVCASRQTVAVGVALGIAMFAILALQAFGLSSISTTGGAFLSSSTMVLVPILQAVMTRRAPRRTVIEGTLVAFVGIAVLTGVSSASGGVGAVLYLASAFIYAVHILIVDRFADRADMVAVCAVELAVAAVLSCVFAFALETPRLPATGAEWGSVLMLGLVCSAFGLGVQPMVQRYTTPERYGVLFGLSPVFSAVLGTIFLGETLGIQGTLGAVLVLAGVLMVVARRGNGAQRPDGLKIPEHTSDQV